MNNYNDQSVNEPVGCKVCHSAMTEQQEAKHTYLKCDSPLCANVVQINGDIACDELEEILQEHTDVMNTGRVMALEMLLQEISLNKLTEIYQVEELIKSKIDSKGEQYAAEANADHLTEQIPNV